MGDFECLRDDKHIYTIMLLTNSWLNKDKNTPGWNDGYKTNR